MKNTLYFYDLETSGFNPRDQRIMQFAGQRTDLLLNTIGEPDSYLIKLSDDTLPDPDAVLLTGITPQITLTDGISEAEFLKIFNSEISLPGTIFTGFNNIRFDDEFMRFLNYRNFYDAYEWHWADGRSRWDMLDVIRMTRALRPDGINWPVDSNGAPVNSLEKLTGVNKLTHDNAHDALSDVNATISLARLLYKKQPKLFNYLLNLRDKKKVELLVNSDDMFVYTCGKYNSEFHKTSIVTALSKHPKQSGVIVYDLRYDPTPFLDLKSSELAELWQHHCGEYPCTHGRLPVKLLQYNRCPAVAPLTVLDKVSQKNIGITLGTAKNNLIKLSQSNKFISNIIGAVEIMNKAQQQRFNIKDQLVDDMLYDKFIDKSDRPSMALVSESNISTISNLDLKFHDERLTSLLPLYKARNFYKQLNDEERKYWENFRKLKLLSGNPSRAEKYFNRVEELSSLKSISKNKKYILDELQLYGQAILPDED